ncbi:O-antigen ligase family protein [Winogradskyella echinorum]|uniref:O-antigen ligase family protein n=1 Tax=Winogradskyella echinorum TaxID=538189 RepID=A0ABR6Y0E8_9FLAO|nr:O-antigen ligase family protein [Winogradskyella echinorum]MBC3846226.1 O-antigen ligase family protein [Winogradskyella echinorum]MBC5750574.1 O-antigen ligase family protein [Winogradskyella echinorum]
MSQLFAYANLGLIVAGLFLFRKNIETTSTTNRLWFVYYLIYYCFGILATGLSGFQPSLAASLIPLIYFVGFYFLLSNREQFEMFFKVITFSFVVSAIITVILIKLNYSLGSGGVYARELDRAEGLYGDANNAALASIIAYILFDKFFIPWNFITKVTKILILLLLFYSVFLTFSTTGLFVFTIVFFITNYKFFTGIRLILLGVLIAVFYVGIFALKSETKNLDLSKAQIVKIDNIINVLTLNLDKVDNSGRGDLVQNVIQYIYENPILGNGVEFSGYMRGHNTYVGIWVDAGIFTFILFLFILFYYFFKTFTLEKHLRFFAMAILIVLYIFMVSLQSVINQPYLIVLFVFIGYMIDNNRINEGHLDFFKKPDK